MVESGEGPSEEAVVLKAVVGPFAVDAAAEDWFFFFVVVVVNAPPLTVVVV